MSSLVYLFTEDTIAVATDTRVSHPEDFRPHKFTTKAFPLPHLRCILAGTGVQQVIMTWYGWVLTQSKATTIEELNEEAKTQLVELYVLPQLSDNTATIYHFGFGIGGKCKGFAYRSERGFESEELTCNALAIKPGFQEILDTIETMTFDAPLDQWSFIIREQRRIDDALEKSKRVGIGGEMILTTLTKDGFGISCFDRFEDYEEMKESFQNR